MAHPDDIPEERLTSAVSRAARRAAWLCALLTALVLGSSMCSRPPATAAPPSWPREAPTRQDIRRLTRAVEALTGAVKARRHQCRPPSRQGSLRTVWVATDA